jgi:hypothetical protein
VVLVPVSVFNDNLLRGPVPFGLRAPDPGLDPDVSGAFTIFGVPAGTYKVLAAFENDFLVRDPDTSIGGTELQEITVESGRDQTIAEGFKITGALDVVGPGAEVPEVVSGTPTFVFADDSSEDGYIVRVFDVFGEVMWEKLDVPRGEGRQDGRGAVRGARADEGVLLSVQGDLDEGRHGDLGDRGSARGLYRGLRGEARVVVDRGA